MLRLPKTLLNISLFFERPFVLFHMYTRNYKSLIKLLITTNCYSLEPKEDYIHIEGWDSIRELHLICIPFQQLRELKRNLHHLTLKVIIPTDENPT